MVGLDASHQTEDRGGGADPDAKCSTRGWAAAPIRASCLRTSSHQAVLRELQKGKQQVPVITEELAIGMALPQPPCKVVERQSLASLSLRDLLSNV